MWRRRYNQIGRLRWAGHIARSDRSDTHLIKRLLEATPTGIRTRDRSNIRWKSKKLPEKSA